MYDTREEANQKLSGSVVLFNDSPVFIHEAVGKGSKLQLRYQLLRTKEERANLIQEKGWEFRNLGPRLGYSNIDLGKGSYQEAMYIMRSPVRNTHSTQGISQRNLKYSSLKGSQRLGLSRMNLPWSSLYTQTCFCDMLEKKYPTLEEVTKDLKINDFLCSKAFHRQFSISRADKGDVVPFYLEYRDRRIGYSEDLYRWRIGEDYQHLNETLQHLNMRVS
mgnify:FL=1